MRSDIDDGRGQGVPTGSGYGSDDVAEHQSPPDPVPGGQSSRVVEQLEVVEGKGKRQKEEEKKQKGSFVNSLRSGEFPFALSFSSSLLIRKC